MSGTTNWLYGVWGSGPKDVWAVGARIIVHWNGVDWEYWERREDRRCANCKMHSGFEASAVKVATSNPKEMVKLAMWHMSG